MGYLPYQLVNGGISEPSIVNSREFSHLPPNGILGNSSTQTAFPGEGYARRFEVGDAGAGALGTKRYKTQHSGGFGMLNLRANMEIYDICIICRDLDCYEWNPITMQLNGHCSSLFIELRMILLDYFKRITC